MVKIIQVVRPLSSCRHANFSTSLRALKHARSLGQALPHSHPHLFENALEAKGTGSSSNNEQSIHEYLTPGIKKSEYEMRRLQLQSKLPSKSILIVPGYGLRYSTNTVFYPFHQTTDALYLTGFNQPESVTILASHDLRGNSLITGFSMFVQPYDPNTEIWDGPKAGLDGARDTFGAEMAYPISTFEQKLKNIVQELGINTIFTNLPLLQAAESNILADNHISLNGGSATHTDKIEATPEILKARLDLSSFKSSKWFLPSTKVKVKAVGELIEDLRCLKSKDEMELMRVAGKIGGRAHVEAMRATKPGMSEHQISAILEYHGKMNEATGLSYVPVVAGGTNALTIHYVQNNCILNDGDLVLVDAGVEYNGYVSDITRTWPVNGKFSEAQRDLYQCVLTAQKELIRRAVIGKNTSLNSLQDDAQRLLMSGLTDLFERRISRKEMDILYPHHVGHYLGLDVHDTPKISRNKALKEGMVITIEPGIYVPDIPEYGIYRGIGIRIEDDVYISAEGPVVLSVEAAKEIVDIESIMKG